MVGSDKRIPSERRTADGKAGVVRNGHLPGREIQTGVGPVTVKIPLGAKTGTSTFKQPLDSNN